MIVSRTRKIVGDNLQWFMNEHKLSSIAVYEKTTVSKTMVNYIRKAERSCSIDRVALLAHGFKVPVFAFFIEDGVKAACKVDQSEITALFNAFLFASPDTRNSIVSFARFQAKN